MRLETPQKPREAALLQGRKSRIIAGGTLVVTDHNYGRLGVDTLVSLDRLGLDSITVAGGAITLGAMATMAKIAGDRRLAVLHPVARSIGGPAVRAMATVGGNLFAPAPYGDMAAALLALDARITFFRGGRSRTLPIEDFIADRSNPEGVLVLSIAFDRPAKGSFRFTKAIRRKPVSAAIVTIAAVLPVRRGRITGARIVYGAMGLTPLRARMVESALEGKLLDRSTISLAKSVASEGTHPEDDAYASAWYRREVLPVHLERLLTARHSDD